LLIEILKENGMSFEVVSNELSPMIIYNDEGERGYWNELYEASPITAYVARHLQEEKLE